jgi:hypothetical protein
VLFRAALGRPALTGATALAIVSASTAAVAAATGAPGSVVDRLGASGTASAQEIGLTSSPFGVTQGRATSRVYDAVQRDLRDQRIADSRRAARAAYRKALFSANPKVVAKAMMLSRFGWGASQFSCLDSLWNRESKWSIHATNPTSGAYGIPQALPGSKMSSAGPNWQTNPITQISWGLGYIRARYGTPCGAWGHSEGHGWY